MILYVILFYKKVLKDGKYLDKDKKMMQYYEKLRRKIVNVNNRSIRLTKISGLEESKDKNCHINCEGYGRLRKYKNFSLFLCNEVDGLNKKLLRGLPQNTKEFTTQVFQIAGCNMRCWYCFVDDCILSVEGEQLQWIEIKHMIDIYENEKYKSPILDLSGGQPDLVPEWCYWVMLELEKRGLKDTVYIWLDDNLTTIDILEKHLSQNQIRYMACFPKHSRACCFKGYDDLTFKYNTRNSIITIEDQINAFQKLYNYGFDIYAYMSLTGPKGYADIQKIDTFIKKIRKIDINLPLKIIPLKINEFTVTRNRMNDDYTQSLYEQIRAYEIWKKVMSMYYTKSELEKPFEDVELKGEHIR